MLFLLSARNHAFFTEWLNDMYRLRYRVFKERLKWSVETVGDLEIDRFDDLGPAYLLQVDATMHIRGCVRLVPTTGPYMLRDVFADLVSFEELPSDPQIWESSRFAVEITGSESAGAVGGVSSSQELFAGMIEFGLAAGIREIVTVTDTRIERILRRANWPLRRLGAPKMIGSTEAVAGFLEVSIAALHKVRERAAIAKPVLWKPVLEANS